MGQQLHFYTKNKPDKVLLKMKKWWIYLAGWIYTPRFVRKERIQSRVEETISKLCSIFPSD